MSSTAAHRICVCIRCKERDFSAKKRKRGYATEDIRPGIELAAELRKAIADGATTKPFEVSEIACMSGCDRPCTVSFSAPNKATYLFGDLSPAEGIEPLLEFANQYARLADGWSSSGDRPKGLMNKTLARIPAIGGQALVSSKSAGRKSTEQKSPRQKSQAQNKLIPGDAL